MSSPSSEMMFDAAEATDLEAVTSQFGDFVCEGKTEILLFMLLKLLVGVRLRGVKGCGGWGG